MEAQSRPGLAPSARELDALLREARDLAVARAEGGAAHEARSTSPLDVYGPFKELRLRLRSAARSRILSMAPTRPARSSALAAIGDLFYGAPRREKISFLRPKDMRHRRDHSRPQRPDAAIFSPARRQEHLADAAGSPLPDDALAPFLGAATREIFDRAFGLDAQSLRQGGDEMLHAEGEIGASLFAAASGLRGLLDLRKEFEAEADEIFGDRQAGHRAFYQALDRYDAARAREGRRWFRKAS